LTTFRLLFAARCLRDGFGRQTTEGTMSVLEVKHFQDPDEVSSPDALTRFQTVAFGAWKLVQGVHEPGWRWSEHRGRQIGARSCPNSHVLYVVSGRLGARMDDGSEAEFGAGDVVSLGPGRDLWVIGDEPAVELNLASGAQAPTIPR